MLSGKEKFNYDAVSAMFRRAYNICHLKDSEVDDGKVVGIDLERTIGIAKTAAYKGYFSVECEGQGDPYVETGQLVDQAIEYLP